MVGPVLSCCYVYIVWENLYVALRASDLLLLGNIWHRGGWIPFDSVSKFPDYQERKAIRNVHGSRLHPLFLLCHAGLQSVVRCCLLSVFVPPHPLPAPSWLALSAGTSVTKMHESSTLLSSDLCSPIRLIVKINNQDVALGFQSPLP